MTSASFLTLSFHRNLACSPGANQKMSCNTTKGKKWFIGYFHDALEWCYSYRVKATLTNVKHWNQRIPINPLFFRYRQFRLTVIAGTVTTAILRCEDRSWLRLSAFYHGKRDCCPKKCGFIYLVCSMPTYTQSRGILLHVCANMGVCPKTAHLIHKSTVIYTLNITIFIFLIHMYCYSIKWLVKVSSSSM